MHYVIGLHTEEGSFWGMILFLLQTAGKWYRIVIVILLYFLDENGGTEFDENGQEIFGVLPCFVYVHRDFV